MKLKDTDPTRLVADSIKAGKPFVFVSINYRLNIFSFGDGGETNLAIKDQRLGLEWVREYISAFGGNKNEITLAGESAGAVYVHAHLITGPPVKRAVLASGSLYLSSPLPVERSAGLIKALQTKVQDYGQSSLREASVQSLLQALKESNVNTMWIQECDELKGWETRVEQADEVMIGDVEYEVGILLLIMTCTYQCSPSSGETESRLLTDKPSLRPSSKTRPGAQNYVKCTMLSLIVRLHANSGH